MFKYPFESDNENAVALSPLEQEEIDYCLNIHSSQTMRMLLHYLSPPEQEEIDYFLNINSSQTMRMLLHYLSPPEQDEIELIII